MGKSKADKTIQAYNSGKHELDSIASLTRVCARYFKPEYNDLTIDPIESEISLPNTSAPIISHWKMVGGLFSNTIAMGRGLIESGNPELREREAPKRFYKKIGEKADDIMQIVFPEPYHQSLSDYCLGSVGVLYVHFDEETNEHEIEAHNASDCVWYLDRRGKPMKMYRKFEYTADQAVEHFGYDSVSEDVQKAYDKDDNKKFEFIHGMYPRKKRNAKRKDSKNMPFEVVYVEVNKRKTVMESGTYRFRYVVYVQNKRRGMRTGYSSAMLSLPATRTAVRAIDDYFDASEFKSRPAMFMDDENSVDNAQALRPGDVRQADLTTQPFLYGGDNDPSGAREVAEVQFSEIEQLHFLDLFQALEHFKEQTKTAYEVSQIIAEKIFLIYPTINSVKGMFSDVITILAQDIIQYNLSGEEPPEEILTQEDGQVGVGDEFRVKYTSRIDTRLSGVETENILFAIQEMVEAENLLMNSTHSQAIVKIEEVLTSIAERRNLDVEQTRNSIQYKEELSNIQNQRMAQMKAQADAQALAKRDLNKAPEEGSEAE
jgi:hypothetical protein